MTPQPTSPQAGPLRRRLRRMLVRCLWFFLLGAAVNVAVAYAMGLFVDVSQGRVESAAGWSGFGQWTVTRWARRGATYVLSVREPGTDWSPGQATGPPDTPTGGDKVTAWAPQTPDGQAEWLLLQYARAVVPTALKVYEICSAGAVNKVTVFDDAGNEVEVWSGIDPAPAGASIATTEIPLRPPGFATNRVKVYLDSPRFPGWNEIDAVGLVGPGDRVQWAAGAEASSTFASTRAGLSLSGGGPPALAPPWGGLHAASDDFTNFRVRREERALDARGWPMLSLWGEVPTARVARQTTGAAAGGGAMSVTFTAGFLLAGTTAAPGPAAGEPPLLIHPIWRGFLFNACFYGIVLACAFWLLTGPRRFVRELARMRRGRCIACGYDLNFNFIPGCPECGWRRSTARIPPAPGS